MTEKTLGQIAYEAHAEYLKHSDGWDIILEWERIPECFRVAWEAAARAVTERCAEIVNRVGLEGDDDYEEFDKEAYDIGVADAHRAILDLINHVEGCVKL